MVVVLSHTTLSIGTARIKFCPSSVLRRNSTAGFWTLDSPSVLLMKGEKRSPVMVMTVGKTHTNSGETEEIDGDGDAREESESAPTA